MPIVKVNQIASYSGNTLTVGTTGDTVTLATGATATGFAPTGAVTWSTTVKTAGFTAVSKNGYFVDTTSGAITVLLPATPAAGDIVAISDYADTAATNNITIDPNGNKINGGTFTYKITSAGLAITFVYVDSTRGWKDVGDATLDPTGLSPYIVATGGTITTCGNYKIHKFTSSGCFVVSQAGTPAGSTAIDYLVIAGGAAGGTGDRGAGGGAGGYRESKSPTAPWTASPLATSTSITAAATTYPIIVGGGGAGVPLGTGVGTSGSPSVFSTITSAGGGGGGGGGSPAPTPTNQGLTGGSGGGSGILGIPNNTTLPGGAGNTPPVSPPQGNNGGWGQYINNAGSGGGGGAGAVGCNAIGPVPGRGGAGGNGVTTSITSSPVTYAGGGGGAGDNGPKSGGTGGGGAAGAPGLKGVDGTANTGGGGGGGGSGANPGPGGTFSSGGSGIVVIRYKYQ